MVTLTTRANDREHKYARTVRTHRTYSSLA